MTRHFAEGRAPSARPRCGAKLSTQPELASEFWEIVTCDCIACLRDLLRTGGPGWTAEVTLRVDTLRAAQFAALEAEVQRLRATMVQAQLDPRPLPLAVEGAINEVRKARLGRYGLIYDIVLAIIDRLEGRS